MLAEDLTGRAKVEIGRFKGLGEMSAKQLKDTTMSPETRTLLRVAIADREDPDSARARPSSA
jgi:topoisomerase-4 subunit B